MNELYVLWLILCFAVPLAIFMGCLLYILWPWREIPLILWGLSPQDHTPIATQDAPEPPEPAVWYQQAEPAADPTKKDVHWAEEPDMHS